MQLRVGAQGMRYSTAVDVWSVGCIMAELSDLTRSCFYHLISSLWLTVQLRVGAQGMRYSTAVDVWSVGCIMAELLTNKVLFPGAGEFDQMNRIWQLLGTPNETIWPGYKKLGNCEKARPLVDWQRSETPPETRTHDHALIQLWLNWLAARKHGACGLHYTAGCAVLMPVPSAARSLSPMQLLICINQHRGDLPELCRSTWSSPTSCQAVFMRSSPALRLLGADKPGSLSDKGLDLLKKLLKLDPAQRITAAEALDHPWCVPQAWHKVAALLHVLHLCSLPRCRQARQPVKQGLKPQESAVARPCPAHHCRRSPGPPLVRPRGCAQGASALACAAHVLACWDKISQGPCQTRAWTC